MSAGVPPAQAMPADTDVWIVDLAASAEALLAVDERRWLLTESERERASRILDVSLRERWIATHTALHLVLADHIGRAVRFVETRSTTTKPRVADWDGDFSLSHSGTLALIAIRNMGHVGIDAEVRRSVRMSAERRRLIEAAAVAALPDTPLPESDPEMSFLMAWTRLEAIGKMRATGIGALLETLGIIARGPGADVVAARARRLMSEPDQPVGLCDLDVGSFDAVAALATSPPAGAPRLHDLSTAHRLLRA